MAMPGVVRELIAGAGAVATFLGLHFGAVGFDSLPMKLGLAAAVYLGLRLLLPRKREKSEVMTEAGLSVEALERLLQPGFAKARQFIKFSYSIPRKPVAENVKRIGEITENIFRNIQNDPNDLHAARNFIDYNLDKALEVVEGYVKLAALTSMDDHARQQLAEAERAIEVIEKGFEAQYKELLANDFRTLSHSANTLARIIEAEQPDVMLARQGKDR